MADINLKTETPDTTLPTTGFLFGADSQAAASPSVYSTQTVATTLLGSTSLTGATVTTSQPVLDLSQTWNDGGTTFTGLRFNATDTASAAGSLLMDLQVGGSSQLRVTKAGRLLIGTTSGGAGFGTDRLGAAMIYTQSTAVAEFFANGINIPNTSGLNWSFDSAPGNVPDLRIRRRAAANLQLGAADTSASATITVTIAAPGVVTWSNHSLSTGSPVIFTTTGALPTGITADTTYYAIVVSANTFQLASSFANALAGTAITTSGSQSGTHTGRRGAIAQQFGPQDTLSTGSLENIDGADFVIRGSRSIGNKPGGSIIFQVAPAGSSGTAQNALATAWSISGAGHFLAGADNTYDIGASGASRPRNVYAGTILAVGPGTPPASTAIYASINGATWNRTVTTSSSSYAAVSVTGTGVNDRLVLYAFSSSYASSGKYQANASLIDAKDDLYYAASNHIFYSGLMTFGGKTSSFPALKRSTTTLQVRLADDSGDADLTAKALTLSGNLTISTKDIVTDTTTGTKIGTGTTQKIGFYNATPVVQPTAVADATDAATVITQLNALLSRMRDLGLIAT